MTEADKSTAEKKLSFEQSLEKLEKIVAEIEAGHVPLETSIARYAEGIELVKQCRKTLDAAERKIQMLTKGSDDQLQPDGYLDELEPEND
ncbi:MAG: exodeoxyribonuclease VII small subunit [Planctomycetota bacterium]